ncbi:MAG: hypothetical protein MR051_02930 [Lentisphaeria bacterium]|nr:hypothetical protein [Lentisphaeria bacterium]
MRHLLLIAALTTAAAVSGRDICVDYQSGKAGNPGTREAPLATAGQALKLAAPGDVVRILPSDRPIRDNIRIVNLQGTAENPITIDGMNNIFLGTLPLSPDVWKEVSPGLYQKEMKTGRNWTSRFYLTFNGRINRMGRLQKAGSPGAKYKKPEELVPGEWTVVERDMVDARGPHKQFNFDFVVRLPEGAESLESSGVEEPNIRKNGGVNLQGKCRHLILRNLIVKNFFNDGYNLHGDCENIHFENIAAVDCGDDGISAHEACKLTGKNMVFIGCSTAICHIADVTSSQENVYAERISGREFFFLANSDNTVKNAWVLADSFSGSRWQVRKGNHQKGRMENVFMLSNNPKSAFLLNVDKGGKLDLALVNVQLAGFRQVTECPGIVKADPDVLRKFIAEKRAEMFARFGGNLEKALK